MNQICHFIYINFNYIDIDKLKERLEIFENYCLPSLLNQTNKNFNICMNVNMEPEFYTLVKKYKENHAIILKNIEYSDIKYLKDTTKKYFITTRVDSDDALNILYIDCVQKYTTINTRLLEHYKTIILNYSMGIQLNQSSLEIKRRVYNIPSPFLSVISVYNSHCREMTHDKIHQKFHFINLYNKIPMWVQLIHNNNILNQFINGISSGYYNKDLNKLFCLKFDV